tara:strand:- start:393 stop:716 length:324 start_codon:yes stop_codon:yes gene_type:complete
MKLLIDNFKKLKNDYIDIFSKSKSNAVIKKDFKMNRIQKSTKIKEISEGMLGFEFYGQYIIDPTMDETGRYPVDGKKYYSLSKRDILRMIKKNMPQIYKDYPEWKNK